MVLQESTRYILDTVLCCVMPQAVLTTEQRLHYLRLALAAPEITVPWRQGTSRDHRWYIVGISTFIEV